MKYYRWYLQVLLIVTFFLALPLFALATTTPSVSCPSPIYSIDSLSGAGGNISPWGLKNYACGSNVTYNITPDSSHLIARVYIDGQYIGSPNTYTFYNLSADHSIIVSFADRTYSVASSVVGNGTITPSGPSTVIHGNNLSFSFLPAAGSHLASLIIDGSVFSTSTSSYVFSNITANHQIQAVFATNTETHQIVSSLMTSNGNISPAGTNTFSHGSNVTYTITPANGYHTSGIYLDGSWVGAGNSYTINNLSTNHTIAVGFTKTNLAPNSNVFVYTSETLGGHISPLGTTTIQSGGSFVLNITPDVGYSLENITMDGAPVPLQWVDTLPEVSSVYTFNNLTVDRHIKVFFGTSTYQISRQAGAHGQIIPASSNTYLYGSAATFNIVPDSGFQVLNIVVDGISLGATSTHTFSNLHSNHTISAVFSVADFNLISSAGVGGSISPLGLTNKSFGSSQTYSIDPSFGYQISDVLVDGASIGATTTYTFYDIGADHNINAIFSDALSPVITLFGSSTVNLYQFANYMDAGATANDNVDGPLSVASSTNLDLTATGTYQIIYTAIDAVGNVGYATRTVNVISSPIFLDTVAPIVTLIGSSTVDIYKNSTYVDPGVIASDETDGILFATSSSTVDTSATGTQFVIWQASDTAGNIGYATRTVNVIAVPTNTDLIPPVVTLIGSSTINLYQFATYTDLGATALDNLDGTLPIASTTDLNLTATGTYTIYYYATDTAGNVGSTTRTVTVSDNPTVIDSTAPLVTLLGSTTVDVYQNSSYVDAGAFALDAVDGTLPVASTTDLDLTTLGAYSVIYSATNISNNIGYATRTVNVIASPTITDVTAPIVTLNGSSTVDIYKDSIYLDLGATALDDVDGILTPTTTSVINTSAIGTQYYIWSAVDSHNNVGYATRTINILDRPIIADIIAPVVTLNGSSTVDVYLNSSYDDLGATANDNVDGILAVASSTDLNLTATGTYSINYFATDTAGNIGSTTRTVNVIANVLPIDNIAPVITLLGAASTSIPQYTIYVDAGASALDAVDGVIIPTISFNNLATDTLGSYNIVYSAIDVAGNAAYATRTVNVVASSTAIDTVAPVVTLLGSSTINIYQNSVYDDLGAIANDNVDGVVTVASSTNLDLTVIGSYSINYFATDTAGNIGYATRTINVIAVPTNTDLISPVVTLIGSSTINLYQFATYTDLGATALDNLDGTLPIASTTDLNLTATGTYTIYYYATDTAGNVGSTTRTVNILENIGSPDTVAPVITLLGLASTSVFMGGSYSDPGAYALDAVDGVVAVASTTNLDLNILGTYTINYFATDTALNVASTSRTINVITTPTLQDTVPPLQPSITNISQSTGIILKTDSTIDLNVGWSSSNDAGSRLAEYAWLIDSASTTVINSNTIGTTTTSATGTDQNLGLGTFWFHVAARDNAGNYSNTSTAGPFVVSDSDVLITDSTIGGTYYDFYSPATSSPFYTKIYGTTTISHSILTTDWQIVDSQLTGIDLDNTYLTRVVTASSTFRNSDMADCSINNSLVKNYAGSNCTLTDSIIDPPSGMNTIINSTITGSSTIWSSDIINSNIDNSDISSTTVSGSNLINASTSNSQVSSSTISNSVIENLSLIGSTLDNTDLSNATITGATISNGIIESGIIETALGTQTITTPTPLSNFINYKPEAYFSVYQHGFDVTLINESSDPNEGTGLSDAWTIVWQLSDGTQSTTTASTTKINLDHSFDSATYHYGDNFYITLSITDNYGLTSSTSTTITLVAPNVDVTAPIIALLGNSAMSVLTNATFTDPGVTASDDTDGDITNRVTVSGSVNTAIIGTYLLTYNVFDLAGNQATVIRTVVVSDPIPDVIAPVVTLNGSTLIDLVVGSSTYAELGATASDNIDGDISSRLILTGSVNDTVAGSYQIVYRAIDDAGNSGYATRTINVYDSYLDNVPPVINLIGSSTINLVLGDTYTELGAVATDNVDSSLSVAVGGDTVNTSIVGTYHVSYYATDTASNVGTAPRTVNVLALPADTIPPVVTLTGSPVVHLTVGEAFTDPGATANDNIDGNITASIVMTTDLNIMATGTYYVLYSATDTANNVGSAYRQVIVNDDNIKPVLTLLGATTTSVRLGDSYSDAGATAVDNRDGDLSLMIASTTNLNLMATGTYSIVYQVHDSAYNWAEPIIRNVVVYAQSSSDHTAPVIILNGLASSTLEAGTSFNDPGATAIDGFDGNLTSSIVVSGSINSMATGTQSLIYNVVDHSGNQAIPKTRTVLVIDTTAPVVTLNGSSTINLTVGDSYVDAGAIASDSLDGDITSKINIVGTVNTSVAGTYTIVYRATDQAGNSGQTSRTIIVVSENRQVENNSTGGGGGSRGFVGLSVGKNNNPAVLGVKVYHFSRFLQFGNGGEDVTQLQKILRAAGFYGIEIDGKFGWETKKAVLLFQRSQGLPQTGFVGRLTIAKLETWSKKNSRLLLITELEERLEQLKLQLEKELAKSR